jgi:hypothetical protein
LAFYFILFFWQSAERILCAEGGLFGRPLKGKEKGAMRVFFFTPRRAEKLNFFLPQNKNNSNFIFLAAILGQIGP